MEWLWNLMRTMFSGKNARLEEFKIIISSYRKLTEDLQRMVALLEEKNKQLESKDDEDETHQLFLQLINLIKEKRELESQLLFWSKLKNGNGKH